MNTAGPRRPAPRASAILLPILCTLFSGCSTVETVQSVARGEGVPLDIVSSQRGFARFEPIGDSSARLRLQIPLSADFDDADLIAASCYKEEFGLKVYRQSSNVVVEYMAGFPGEVVPRSETSVCRTSAGLRNCGRMRADYLLFVCLNPSWKEDLRTMGRGIEIQPSRLKFEWRCVSRGSCSLAYDGVPFAGEPILITQRAHSDKVILMLRSKGLPSERVQEWLDAQLPPEELGAWLDTGLLPNEAAEWSRRGFKAAEHLEWKFLSVEAASRSRQAGMNSKEAKQQHDREMAENDARRKRDEEAESRRRDQVANANRLAEERRLLKESSRACLSGARQATTSFRSIGTRLLNRSRLSSEEMSDLCGVLERCIKACGSQKCGELVPALFGGPGLVRTCDSIRASHERLLAPPAP